MGKFRRISKGVIALLLKISDMHVERNNYFFLNVVFTSVFVVYRTEQPAPCNGLHLVGATC